MPTNHGLETGFGSEVVRRPIGASSNCSTMVEQNAPASPEETTRLPARVGP
jgi:hypothetical protein